MNSRWLDSKLRWAASAFVALLVLCLAGSTQAEPRLYTGSLIIHAFGNDTTDGATPPFQTGSALGIPLTGNCNTEPFHAKETLTFPTTDTDPPTDTIMFTIPNYGGASGSPPPGCESTVLESGDPLRLSEGPDHAARGAIRQITTTGAISTSRNSCAPGPCTDPRKFTIAANELNRYKDFEASFNRYGVYHWEVHFADLHNDVGVFSAGGGDGDFGPIDPSKAAKQKRSVSQKAGKNQFGGVMTLLGSYGDNEGYYNASIGTVSVFYYNWLFNYLGASGQATKAGEVTRGYVYGPVAAFGYSRLSGMAYTSFAEIEVFKWTTGTVSVTAVGGTFPTNQQRKGYDHRTAMGSGVVQLVSPMLSQWEGATSGTASATAGIGIMKISFAPEPSEWMLLAGGVSMLGLLIHRRRAGHSR